MRLPSNRNLALAAIIVGMIGANRAWAEQPTPLPSDHPEAKQQAEKLDKLPPIPASRGVRVDHSGRIQKGRASIYAHHFANRRMADGRRMNPNADIAASKQLPLGAVAKVTNLENGKSATVKIEDRGPFIDGRVVDVTPKVAEDLQIRDKGIVPVEVKPITVPTPDGQVKLGSGAAEASPNEVAQAVETTKSLTGSKETTEAAR